MFLVGLVIGKDYIVNCEDTLSAPKNTRAERDFEAFEKLFPEFAKEKRLIVLIQCKPQVQQCQVVCPSEKCGKKCKSENDEIAQAIDKMATEVIRMRSITSYQSYYNLSGTLLDEAKCSFASKDGRSTFLSFTFNDDATNPERHHVINSLRNNLFKSLNPDFQRYKFGLTGFDAMAKDGSEEAILQIIKVDVFTMPVAFALLGYMVRSWRLLLLAFINTGVTLAFTFGVLSIISKYTHTRPLSTASSLVEVLGLAMATDYSLFLLRRFRDEIKNHRTTEVAIKIAFFYAGHVVVLSSITFSCVFVGFQFLPSKSFRILGTASLISILTALVVCLSLTLSLLLTFPIFFSSISEVLPLQEEIEDDVRSSLSSETIISPLIRNDEQYLQQNEDLSSPPSHIASFGRTPTGKFRYRRGAKYLGCYFNFLRFFTKFPQNIIFLSLVYGASIPIALQALRLEHNQDVTQAISRNAPSTKTFEDLRAAFSGGTLSPFYVIIESSKPMLEFKQEAFDFTNNLIKDIVKETGVNKDLVISVTNMQGHEVSYAEAMKFRNSNSKFCQTIGKSDCLLYQYIFNQFAKETSFLVSFTIDENPYGKDGADFIVACLNVIEKYESDSMTSGKFYLHLAGDEVSLNADQIAAFESLPPLILSTILVIFVLLGVGFQSILTPVRLSLTVLFPLLTVFGFAVLVYQDGLLEFLNFNGLKKTELGFYWYVPIVCLMQSLGLTIDYDVFCLSRIAEHRSDGYDIQAAIIKAVWEVSSTICVAGLIMAAVFSGLMLGDSPSLNQFGFLLCTSVLVDTFIVQSLLVPGKSQFEHKHKPSQQANQMIVSNCISRR